MPEERIEVPKERIEVEKILYCGDEFKITVGTSSDGRISFSEEQRDDILYLGKQGFKVDFVQTASDAYGSLKLNPYDLLILTPECIAGTLRMKKGHLIPGQTLLGLMQEDKPLSGLPVLISTCWCDLNVEKSLRGFPNVVEVLDKPYLSDRLLEYIQLKRG